MLAVTLSMQKIENLLKDFSPITKQAYVSEDLLRSLLSSLKWSIPLRAALSEWA